MIRLLWFLLALGRDPTSNQSCGSLTSSVGRLVPQPLPRGFPASLTPGQSG